MGSTPTLNTFKGLTRKPRLVAGIAGELFKIRGNIGISRYVFGVDIFGGAGPSVVSPLMPRGYVNP